VGLDHFTLRRAQVSSVRGPGTPHPFGFPGRIIKSPLLDRPKSDAGYARRASRAASTVASTSMSEWAAEVKAASNWLHGR
jgi:hypothetical protein